MRRCMPGMGKKQTWQQDCSDGIKSSHGFAVLTSSRKSLPFPREEVWRIQLLPCYSAALKFCPTHSIVRRPFPAKLGRPYGARPQ
jgi:hypothetical protein